VATLNVLAGAGDERPLVVLVDDLEWVDPESRRVLSFVARRLASERVALVLTASAGYNEAPQRRCQTSSSAGCR
jgi:predicted ATPase